MKKFLVLYRAPNSAREQMANSTPEQAKKGMEMWMAWANKAGPAIVDLGSPLADPQTIGGASSATGHIGGFSVLQGESIDHIRKVLDGHPHFMMPGGTIDVLEFLPIPGM